MWLKSRCVACLWRMLHQVARSNTCAPKRFKGSQSRALCHWVLSPTASWTVHFVCPSGWGTVKAVLQKVRRKNIRQVVTGLQGLVEVKVCLTANSLNYCANLLFGEGRFFRKIINFLFGWLVVWSVLSSRQLKGFSLWSNINLFFLETVLWLSMPLS